MSTEKLESLNKIAEALKTPEPVRFLLQHVPEFYASVTTDQPNLARELVRNSFAILVRAANNPSPVDSLVEASDIIYRDIFHQDDPEFWFTPIHQNYNINIKPKLVTPILARRFFGNRILDIGGGSGYLAFQLQKDGYSSALTDVLDYRAEIAKTVSFKRMTSPTHLPYLTDEFDSAILFEVLHHVNPSHYLVLLKEAARVAKRLVIVENTYGDPTHALARIAYEYQDPQPTQDYLSLKPEDQVKVLSIMDYYVNITSKGITGMNLPLTFKTLEEWLILVGEAGFQPVVITQIGFFKNTLNRNFQLYIALDKKPN